MQALMNAAKHITAMAMAMATQWQPGGAKKLVAGVVGAVNAQSAENAGQKKDGEEERVEEDVEIVVKIELFIF